jgi:hypothetical protein
MATLPATGAEISFGRVNRAYTSNLPGSAGNAPAGGQNIKLSAVLGNNPVYSVNTATGTTIKFSATFGGKTGTPHPY